MVDGDFDRRLVQRLRAYESRIPDADPPDPDSARRRWHLLPLVAGGIAAAIVGGAFGIALLLNQPRPVGDPPPASTVSEAPTPSATIATPTPTASAIPDATQAPTPTPRPSGPATIAWSQGEEHEGRVAAVVRRDERWIAGGALSIGGFTRAAIWTSDDGRTWSEPIVLPPEPVPDDEGMNPRYWINGFGEWGGDLLAFGWNGVGCCDAGYPMLWRFNHDDTWAVVDTAGSAFGDAYHFPQRSVVTPQGHLAVLSVTGLGSGTSVFVTRDLATWEEHAITEPESAVALSGIAASPSLLMMVGTEQHPYEVGEDPPTTGHVWSSADGRRWTSLTTPSPNGTLDRVTWDRSRERFVAVGTDDERAPAAWLTADGSTWSRILLAEEVGRMHDLAAADGLIVASGSVGPLFEAAGETIAWSSHDGVTWRVMPVADGQQSSVVGAAPGSAVLIVHHWDEVDGDSWQSWAGPVDE